MFKKFILFHVIPIAIAIAISSILIYLLVLFYSKTDKVIQVEGNQTTTSGRYGNLLEGKQAEIDFYASLKNKKQLTLLGSSEFSDSPYCPYNFFPDTLGIQAIGLGHAYHQNLSILCELLAADEYIDQSKVCIILSLGWFTTGGTNPSAFLEFVRPNFLNNIIQNENIDVEYKEHIGAYIDMQSDDIEGVSNNMRILQDAYLSNSNNFLIHYKVKLRQQLRKISPREITKYKLKLKYIEGKKWDGDFKSIADKLQKDFLSKITNNNLYVYDDYYAKYLINEKGEEIRDSVGDINLVDNNELKDFYLLVKYLKSKNINCSFVIQPLNPYFYPNLNKYDGLVEVLIKELNDKKIPFLNMHVSDKTKYEPGVLNDVMHLGDYGWNKINSFLKKTYYDN